MTDPLTTEAASRLPPQPEQSRALAKQERQQEALDALREGRGIPVLAPILDDPREADFIEEYVRHNDPVRAIDRAGIRGEGKSFGKAYHVLAAELLTKPSIQIGIQVLSRARAYWGSGDITRETIVAELREIVADARKLGKLAEAINAEKLISQLMGLLIERREVTFKKKIEDMTDDELRELAGRAKRAEQRERAVEAEVIPPGQ